MTGVCVCGRCNLTLSCGLPGKTIKCLSNVVRLSRMCLLLTEQRFNWGEQIRELWDRAMSAFVETSHRSWQWGGIAILCTCAQCSWTVRKPGGWSMTRGHSVLASHFTIIVLQQDSKEFVGNTLTSWNSVGSHWRLGPLKRSDSRYDNATDPYCKYSSNVERRFTCSDSINVSMWHIDT